MTNDELDALVVRLRSDTPNMAAGHKAMHEAADELTALRARVAKLEAGHAAAYNRGYADCLYSAGHASTPEVKPVTLIYTNWKGETAPRRIIPRRVWWGSTEWHPEPQWLVTAFDMDKESERDFALKDFGQPTQGYEELSTTKSASQPAQPAAVTVKPLVWIATGDAGDFMAYDPLFERQVLSLEPAAYDTERLDRIMASLNVQPLTVQDAARRVLEQMPHEHECWEVMQNSIDEGQDVGDIMRAALRAIAEGQ